ncbi:DUF6190 family protein [Umezawaea sp. Da 62-37]|uniref:DUF6190 family protein n=1 Tax=Umezawaea sp. Da 62-37 TaxID=3075927 RepID=UPI0028F6DB0E|nr:DUF6190 family protein [Umezawaea sp. Da 62-37]WNV85417.1 DUF6190 family protein [Umezawaea sp. Da 62-37]
MSEKAVIDASMFMAMNSADERIRLAGKRFFVERLDAGAIMSLEQVGRCDAVIWGSHSRAEQDAYYPFMDNLHTDMRIDRVGYDEQDLRVALTSALLTGLPLDRRLTVAFALNRGGTLYTVDPMLVDRTDLALGPLPDGDEVAFPEPLERMYRESLALLVKPEDV